MIVILRRLWVLEQRSFKSLQWLWGIAVFLFYFCFVFDFEMEHSWDGCQEKRLKNLYGLAYFMSISRNLFITVLLRTLRGLEDFQTLPMSFWLWTSHWVSLLIRIVNNKQGDRFIPNRSAMDIGVAHFNLLKESKENANSNLEVVSPLKVSLAPVSRFSAHKQFILQEGKDYGRPLTSVILFLEPSKFWS